MEAHVESMAAREPELAAAFAYARRLREAADFELLKARMLLRAMDEIPGAELHIFVFRAAAEAASLSLQTPFPLLVFPGLFDEKVQAMQFALRREPLSRGKLSLLTATR